MAGDRAGTLIRVSSGNQDEQNQVPDVDGYTASHGYRAVKGQRYVLHDKSAYKGEQQETLDKIVAAMQAGIIKVLVVWHSDRLDRRGVRQALTFLWQVEDAGGRVESVKEGLLDERNLSTIINAHMNNQKSAHLAEQVQIAYNRIRENRAFQGVAPFGYEITGSKYDKRLVIVEGLRLVVADIFRRVIAGESLAEVCNWLDTLKVKRSNRKTEHYAKGEVTPWWPAMLQRLIRHPAYAGTYSVKHYDGSLGKVTIYRHKCEPIVSTRIQRQAIEALANREKRGAKADPANAAMLRGVILCAQCDDSPMYRTNLKINGRADSPRRLHYRCWGRGRHDLRRSCGNTVPMDLADAAVDKIMAGSFDCPIVRYELVKGHDWAEEIKAVKDEISQLGAEDLADDEYDRRLKELRAERDRLGALPADDDKLERVETDEFYSDVYAALQRHERGAWLASHKFRVYASKTRVMVVGADKTVTVDL